MKQYGAVPRNTTDCSSPPDDIVDPPIGGWVGVVVMDDVGVVIIKRS